MANYKIRDKYFVKCNGARIEVTEDIYRICTYYNDKEHAAKRAYYTYTSMREDGTLIRKPSRLVSIFDETISYVLASKSEDPQLAAIKHEQQEMLYRALDALPQELSQVTVLLFIQGYTECELAKQLGVCQATISNRKNKALKLLRDYFESLNITYSDFDLL